MINYEELNALRRRGDFNFVIVRARSPLGAIDSLENLARDI